MKIRALLTTIFAVLLMTACASTPEGTGAPGDIVIEVESLTGGMGGVAVHLVSPVGGRQFIGTLGGVGSTVFDVRDPLLPGEYRLVAQAPNGQTIASRPFILSEPGVRWNVTNNTIFPLGEA